MGRVVDRRATGVHGDMGGRLGKEGRLGTCERIVEIQLTWR